MLGRAVAVALLAAGHAVRAATRAPDRVSELRRLGADVIRANLVDAPSLARACEDVDAVFAAAHGLMARGRHGSHAVDGDGHRALIDAAKAAGVATFVYTSARGAAPGHPVDFFRTKAAVERYLGASGLDHTILRPTAFMEWHVHRLLGRSILESGKATVLGSGHTLANFVAADDVARLACTALTARTGMRARTLDIGGPDNVTRREIVAMYEQHAGQRARVRYVPVRAMRVLSPMLRPIDPVASRLMAIGAWSESTDQTFDIATLPPDVARPATHVEAFVDRAARGDAG